MEDLVLLHLWLPRTGGNSLLYYIHQFHASEHRFEALGGYLIDGIYYYPRGMEEDFYMEDFGPGDFLVEPPQPVIDTMSRSDITVVSGHIYFGIHRYIQRPFRYITVLRDPVERVVSIYHWNRSGRNANREVVNLIQDEGMTLEDFVTEAGYRQADNGQTRRLSGQEPPFGETAHHMLDTAKQHVETGQITAGTLERFTDTLGLFSDRLGWQLEDSDQSSVKVERNVNPDRASLEDIPTRVLDLIRERNALDQELYDFVDKQLG